MDSFKKNERNNRQYANTWQIIPMIKCQFQRNNGRFQQVEAEKPPKAEIKKQAKFGANTKDYRDKNQA